MELATLSEINASTAETIYKRAKEWAAMTPPRQGSAETGLRIAASRHPLFMKGLERMSEVLDKMAEEQYGRTKRDKSTDYAHKFDPAVVTAFKQAYQAADRGQPEPGLAYLYGAVADFCGFAV